MELAVIISTLAPTFLFSLYMVLRYLRIRNIEDAKERKEKMAKEGREVADALFSKRLDSVVPLLEGAIGSLLQSFIKFKGKAASSEAAPDYNFFSDPLIQQFIRDFDGPGPWTGSVSTPNSDITSVSWKVSRISGDCFVGHVLIGDEWIKVAGGTTALQAVAVTVDRIHKSDKGGSFTYDPDHDPSSTRN